MTAFRIAVTSFLITAAALRAGPALAEAPAPANGVNVSIVRTADLDLSTKSGQRQLDQRLSVAAREVCSVASDADLEGKNEVRKCRQDVLARAKSNRDALLAAGERGATIAISASR